MRQRRYYIQRIDPPIGPYDRIVTWDQPKSSLLTRLKWWILRLIGLDPNRDH